jgi:hypothetical protein
MSDDSMRFPWQLANQPYPLGMNNVFPRDVPIGQVIETKRCQNGYVLMKIDGERSRNSSSKSLSYRYDNNETSENLSQITLPLEKLVYHKAVSVRSNAALVESTT